MTIYLPEWLLILPMVWVGMGLLCFPVVQVRLHRKWGHNPGWDWRTTLFGRRNNRTRRSQAFRVATAWLAIVLAWPLALLEVR